MFQSENSAFLKTSLNLILWVTLLLLLIFLSVQPSQRLHPPFLFIHSDKLFHALYYGMLVLLSGGFLKVRWKRILMVLFLVILGILLEFAQQAVPGRSFSYGDMVANSIGAVLALVILNLRGRKGA